MKIQLVFDKDAKDALMKRLQEMPVAVYSNRVAIEFDVDGANIVLKGRNQSEIKIKEDDEDIHGICLESIYGEHVSVHPVHAGKIYVVLK